MWHFPRSVCEDDGLYHTALQIINMADWNLEASRILRGELVRRGITHKRLSQLLAVIGVDESPSAITNKMSRGTFSFAFFLQCMRALGRTHVEVSLDEIGPNRPLE